MIFYIIIQCYLNKYQYFCISISCIDENAFVLLMLYIADNAITAGAAGSALMQIMQQCVVLEDTVSQPSLSTGQELSSQCAVLHIQCQL